MLKDKLVNFLFEFPIAAWDTGDVVRILYDAFWSFDAIEAGTIGSLLP